MRWISIGPHLAWMAALLCAGCGRTITITQYPDFWQPEMEGMAVAVAPFADPPGRPGAGAVLSSKLASALAANGTYQAYNRADLKAVLDERDLQMALTGQTGRLQAQSGVLGAAQVLIVGAATAYEDQSSRETRYDSQPIYGARDAEGKPVITGYRNVPYTYYRHGATVECTASMVRLSDGAVLASAHGAGQVGEEGRNPRNTPQSCLLIAADQAVGQLVERFAVVRKEIRIGKDALQTARRYYDGRWDKTESFEPGGTLFVVVSLPPEADRNTFRLAIVPKGGEQVLAEQTIRWDKGYASRGFEFSPAELFAAAGGASEYTVKFYAGAEPILTRKIKITARAAPMHGSSVRDRDDDD